MKDNLGCLGNVLLAIIIFAIGFGLTYWIGTSDLPDWMKFWLLNN